MTSKFIVAFFIFMSSNIAWGEISMGSSQEFSVCGKLVSAYYQKFSSSEFAFYLNIESYDDLPQNHHVRFTGEDIKLGSSFISAVGKQVKVANSPQSSGYQFGLQVVETDSLSFCRR